MQTPSPANVLGLAMGGPVVIAHGTDEQKKRYLEPILTAEEIWCQGFSEPESGSDLASLKTRAVKDGDEWVVTGQKVWTTLAQFSKWCMLVARTDPDAPKHKGLTYFLMDMEQEGVQVRPLVQITGEGEFNEIFIEEARIPDANVVGGVGNGWAVAITTLMNERAGLAFGAIASIANQLKKLNELAAETARQRRHRRRGPGLPPADRPAPHRGRDDAPQRLPRADQDDAVGHPRAGGLARQVAVGRHQPGRSPSWRSTSRAPTRRSAAAPSTRSPTAPGSTASCARAPTRSRAAPPTSSRTSSPSASSACRGCVRALMYFDLTDEQQAIRATAKDFLAARYKSERIRELADSEAGFEQSDWDEMAELGWTGPGAARGVGRAGARHRRPRRPLRGDGLRAGPLAAALDDDRRPGALALRLRRPARALPAAARRGRAARRPGALGRRLAGDPGRLHDGGRRPTATTSSSTAKRSSSPTPPPPTSSSSPPPTAGATWSRPAPPA